MSNINIKQAVILAGGKGERLKPITNKIPKPMALVNNVPFLDYLINSILKNKISNFVILTGYKSKNIIKRYKKINSINVIFSNGNSNDLSGKRLIDAYDKLDDYFLLVYGDNYWNFNLNSMIKKYKQNNTLISLTAYLNSNGDGEYGLKNNVLFKDNGVVLKYNNINRSDKMNATNIGYFIVDKKTINKSIVKNISFEDYFMNKLVNKQQVSAFLTNDRYHYITDLKSLNRFEKYVLDNNIQPLSKNYFNN